MMKIKTLIAMSLVSLVPGSLFAATELSKLKAQELTPFKQIEIKGRYINSIDAAQAISHRADKEGAEGFYIISTTVYRNNESLRLITANLYQKDAPKAPPKTLNFRSFGGILEYPKEHALKYEPFDIVEFHGYFPNQHNINEAVAKIAADKEAFAFYIDQQNQYKSKNTEVVAYLFKKEAPHRKMRPKDAIPSDSELAQTVNETETAESGYESPTEFNKKYYSAKFSGDPNFSNLLAKPSHRRYTITLPDGKKIQELNDQTAAKMTPFSAIKFRGYFTSTTEISRQIAKRAAKEGANYYHITQILQDSKGPNQTIFADLYR